MQLTMAIRMKEDQISEPVGAALTLGSAVMDMPPRFLRDQVVA